MKKKKNYNKIPRVLMDKIENTEKRYFKIGIKKSVFEKDIENYKKLGIDLDVEETMVQRILPPIENGRYSKYNQIGRIIKRKDLPKVSKAFWGECYPYGNTNASKVSYMYTKEVTQTEEYMPQFYQILVQICNSSEEQKIIKFEMDMIVDKENRNYKEELLFVINLMQENIGGFDVYPSDENPKDIEKMEQVNWELLPPGTADESFVKQYFGKKKVQQQTEILDRYNYIQSLDPECLIRGTNYFSKYFGAKFQNGVVALENVESGNAIYVFQQDWEVLSQLSRSELRKISSSNVTRIIHSGNWKKRLEYELNKTFEK